MVELLALVGQQKNYYCLHASMLPVNRIEAATYMSQLASSMIGCVVCSVYVDGVRGYNR